MNKLFFYEIDSRYINYLSQFEQHLFHNAASNQSHSRKYIGILFEINSMKYFAPLSSSKAKHKKLSDSIDFVKIGDMAVINLNNMFPVADGMYSLKDIKMESDFQYRTLLNNEYRIVKQKADTILANAKMLYEKVANNRTSKLAKRCNNFKLLEEKCKLYVKN